MANRWFNQQVRVGQLLGALLVGLLCYNTASVAADAYFTPNLTTTCDLHYQPLRSNLTQLASAGSSCVTPNQADFYRNVYHAVGRCIYDHVLKSCGVASDGKTAACSVDSLKDDSGMALHDIMTNVRAAWDEQLKGEIFEAASKYRGTCVAGMLDADKVVDAAEATALEWHTRLMQVYRRQQQRPEVTASSEVQACAASPMFSTTSRSTPFTTALWRHSWCEDFVIDQRVKNAVPGLCDTANQAMMPDTLKAQAEKACSGTNDYEAGGRAGGTAALMPVSAPNLPALVQYSSAFNANSPAYTTADAEHDIAEYGKMKVIWNEYVANVANYFKSEINRLLQPEIKKTEDKIKVLTEAYAYNPGRFSNQVKCVYYANNDLRDFSWTATSPEGMAETKALVDGFLKRQQTLLNDTSSSQFELINKWKKLADDVEPYRRSQEQGYAYDTIKGKSRHCIHIIAYRSDQLIAIPYKASLERAKTTIGDADAKWDAALSATCDATDATCGDRLAALNIAHKAWQTQKTVLDTAVAPRFCEDESTGYGPTVTCLTEQKREYLALDPLLRENSAALHQAVNDAYDAFQTAKADWEHRRPFKLGGRNDLELLQKPDDPAKAGLIAQIESALHKVNVLKQAHIDNAGRFSNQVKCVYYANGDLRDLDWHATNPEGMAETQALLDGFIKRANDLIADSNAAGADTVNLLSKWKKLADDVEPYRRSQEQGYAYDTIKGKSRHCIHIIAYRSDQLVAIPYKANLESAKTMIGETDTKWGAALSFTCDATCGEKLAELKTAHQAWQTQKTALDTAVAPRFCEDESTGYGPTVTCLTQQKHEYLALDPLLKVDGARLHQAVDNAYQAFQTAKTAWENARPFKLGGSNSLELVQVPTDPDKAKLIAEIKAALHKVNVLKQAHIDNPGRFSNQVKCVYYADGDLRDLDWHANSPEGMAETQALVDDFVSRAQALISDSNVEGANISTLISKWQQLAEDAEPYRRSQEQGTAYDNTKGRNRSCITIIAYRLDQLMAKPFYTARNDIGKADAHWTMALNKSCEGDTSCGTKLAAFKTAYQAWQTEKAALAAATPPPHCENDALGYGATMTCLNEQKRAYSQVKPLLTSDKGALRQAVESAYQALTSSSVAQWAAVIAEDAQLQNYYDAMQQHCPQATDKQECLNTFNLLICKSHLADTSCQPLILGSATEPPVTWYHLNRALAARMTTLQSNRAALSAMTSASSALAEIDNPTLTRLQAEVEQQTQELEGLLQQFDAAYKKVAEPVVPSAESTETAARALSTESPAVLKEEESAEVALASFEAPPEPTPIPAPPLPPIRRFDLHSCDGEAGGWCGFIEPAFSFQSGNSQVRNFNVRGGMSKQHERWQYGVVSEVNYLSTDGAVSDDSYWIGFEAQYRLDDRLHAYNEASFESAREQGYKVLLTDVAGLEYNFKFNQATNALVALGLGGRHSETNAGLRRNDFLKEGRTQFNWQISDRVLFNELAAVDFGGDLTTWTSTTTLNTQLAHDLALVYDLGLTHYSEVPAATRKLNMNFKVGLRYNFEL